MNHGLCGEPWLPSRINDRTSYALGIVLGMLHWTFYEYHPYNVMSRSDVALLNLRLIPGKTHGLLGSKGI